MSAILVKRIGVEPRARRVSYDEARRITAGAHSSTIVRHTIHKPGDAETIVTDHYMPNGERIRTQERCAR